MTAVLTRLTRADLGRRSAPVRIVHIGLGAFHRAHQAWYTDAVDSDNAWGIAAFTGRSTTAADELSPQDGLFTVIERSAEGDSATVVGSIVEASADTTRLIALIAAPETAIITTTVTEAGYRLLTDGSPDLDDPAVRGDLEGQEPTTALGRILRGLAARRKANAGPIAIVPCDNMPDNGAYVGRGLRALAAHTDPGLATWIDENVSFVSTSVDRITPKTTAADLEVASMLTGFEDVAAVVTEPFRDWVLSGFFPAGRPAWEEAGAQFVDDIEPFEQRKLRLLNGAHSLLAYAGRLRGHSTVAGAMVDPTCRAWVNEFWDEAVQHLPDQLDLPAYRAALLDRFDNARIEHRLEQIGAEGVTKLRVRIAPTLLSERAHGRTGTASIRVLASWIALHCAGTPLTDAHASALADAVASPDPVPALLALVSPALAADAAIVSAVRKTCV